MTASNPPQFQRHSSSILKEILPTSEMLPVSFRRTLFLFCPIQSIAALNTQPFGSQLILTKKTIIPLDLINNRPESLTI